MTVKEAEDILFKIKQDNESKAMIIHNNSSNIQIRWSNKDLKDMAEIQHRCANDNRAIDIVLAEINKLNEKISKAIGHIEACKTTLGNYILSPNETECLLNILDEERRGEYE